MIQFNNSSTFIAVAQTDKAIDGDLLFRVCESHKEGESVPRAYA